MSGNVAEFCLDFYSPDTYKADTVAAINPRGPAKGSGTCNPGRIIQKRCKRCKKRSTRFHKNQSMAGYRSADAKKHLVVFRCIDVGFRVVCEADSID